MCASNASLEGVSLVRVCGFAGLRTLLVVPLSTTCTFCAVSDGGSRVTRDNVSQAPGGVPDILFLASSLVVRCTPFAPASYCSFVIAIPPGQYSGASERLSTLDRSFACCVLPALLSLRQSPGLSDHLLLDGRSSGYLPFIDFLHQLLA